jgi:hypothetical protein
VTVHRSSTLAPADIVRRRAIPVTTPARTLCDLRRVLAADHFESVLRKAEVLRLDVGEQPGYVPDRARSELERRMLALCRAHLLPAPEINVRVGPFEVDFLWRDHALIVETDGSATTGHGPRSKQTGHATFGSGRSATECCGSRIARW